MSFLSVSGRNYALIIQECAKIETHFSSTLDSEHKVFFDSAVLHIQLQHGVVSKHVLKNVFINILFCGFTH